MYYPNQDTTFTIHLLLLASLLPNSIKEDIDLLISSILMVLLHEEQNGAEVWTSPSSNSHETDWIKLRQFPRCLEDKHTYSMSVLVVQL